jgi:hypothetical protein
MAYDVLARPRSGFPVQSRNFEPGSARLTVAPNGPLVARRASVDRPLLGIMVLGVFGFAYAAEVGYQVWLQAQFLKVLPAAVRAAFPAHPRRPWLSFFASLRFQMAVLRYALRDLPEDPVTVTYWKRKMRWSMARESMLVTSLVVSAIVLVALGWRPAWP